MKLTKTILIFILLLGTFLRFYNFPLRYSLGEETVRDAVVGIQSARELQFPLTGAFSSLGPFTFGPLYTYQLSLATLLFRSLYSPWIYLSLMSILYILIIYKIGKLLINNNFGLLLAFLAAISPTQIISATHLTSHNLTNIFAILSVWIFIKLLEPKKSYWWSFLTGLTIGTGISLHYQMVGLLIFPIIIFFNQPKRFLHFINSITGVIITFLPLFFFEANNHWFNVRNLINYFIFGHGRIYIPYRWLFYLRDFWPGFWADTFGVPTWLGIIFIFLSIFFILKLIYQKKLSKPLIYLFIALLFNFVLLRYYWGNRYYGYLNFMRPFVFIFTGFSLYQLTKIRSGKFLLLLLLIGIIYFSFPRISNELLPDSFSAKIYKQVAIAEQKINYDKYQIYGCTKVYKGTYNSHTFSLAFTAELNKRFSKSEMKLALDSPDCDKPKTQKEYPILNDLGMLDFSKATDKDLFEAGWEPVNFNSIYDLNARWWFREQP